MSRDFTTIKVDPLLTRRAKNLSVAVEEQLGDLFLGLFAWLQDATGGDERRALALLKGIDDAGGIEAVLSGRQPAQPALGAGTTGAPGGPPTIDTQQAVQVIQNDPNLNDGQKNAVLRVLNPSRTDGIFVDANGTPNEIADLQQNLSQARGLTKAALEGVGLTTDPNDTEDTIRRRVQAQITGPDTAAIKKAKDELDKVKDALGRAHDGLRPNTKVLPKDELEKAVKATDDAADLL